MNAIDLSLFVSQLSAICSEMGAVLRRAAFSTNIKDRLDFSCAVFDERGALCAQAAHIPVHLGSMAYAMGELVQTMQWASGDMVIVNDPFLGGTHLPDITLIAPVFVDGAGIGFVANRAHHADIGAHTPGSMPVSRSLFEEGLVIAPVHLLRAGQPVAGVLDDIAAATANPAQMRGDLAAQISANLGAVAQLQRLAMHTGVTEYRAALDEVNDYGERLARESLRAIPDGCYRFADMMDDDGMGNRDIPVAVAITVQDGTIEVDFTGTAPQVAGNINCPLSVAAAAVLYVFRCLMPAHTPACAGSFRAIRLHAPAGCLLNAQRPAAVAAGNVETSSRVVDVVMGALAQAIPALIPAASQGTMNNLAMGARHAAGGWDYYETLGGGCGAGCRYAGLSAVQSHMTNTLNTPIEVLELAFPLRIGNYRERTGSGRAGAQRRGDGLVREYTFLAPATVTILSERRTRAPWGLHGGADGAPGSNLLDGAELPAKVSLQVGCGQTVTLVTPGGGGWGADPVNIPVPG